MNSSINNRSSRDWARAMVNHKQGFLVLDSETTGFRGTDEIVELAVINERGVVLFNQRFRPVNPIPPEATRIHGISNGDVVGCSTFGNLYTEIYDLLRRRELIFFNAAFDLRFLDQTAARFYLPPFGRKLHVHCAMQHYRDYAGERRGTLAQACAALGVQCDDVPLHSALGDAMLTLELVKAMAMAETGTT